MMKRYLFFLLCVTLIPVSTSANIYASIAKISVVVVNEDGKPIEDAKVKVGFKSTSASEGKTDDDGRFSVTSSSDDGIVVGTVNKENYYESVFSNSYTRQKFGFWQPWNKEFPVVLRPIINPVPMYVRDRWIEIPAVGKEIGFDLEKFAWVVPYGLGIHADFIFKLDRRYKNFDEYDVTLSMTFANLHDGIQVFKDDHGGIYNTGSWFRFPRIAPLDGYESKLVKRQTHGSAGWHEDFIEDNNYLFRVRTEVDEEGRLKQAMYGKIRGDMQISVSNTDTAKVHLSYYLNPDYTRNLEFDPNQNLFGPLPASERLAYP